MTATPRARGDSRVRMLLPFGAALLSFLAVSACSDFDRLVDVAFPPSVPGLADGQGWLDLPIGGWVAESGISAEAIAACFARTCPAPASVGLFRAEGRDAALLSEIIAHPDRLKAALERADAADRAVAKSAHRAHQARSNPVKVAVTVAPFADNVLRGFTIRIARRDGGKAAYGAVLAAPNRAGSLAFVLVVAASDEDARRLAASTAAGLS